MKVGSLFSGIGGLELGLRWAGVGDAVWQVEIDPFCRELLAKNFPHSKRYEDVKTVGAKNLERVEVICGGFPCQDISHAGKGAGLKGERSGLYFEYLRVIQEMQPQFVVIENVAALLSRGFDVVLQTLDESGYDAEWSCIRASDVGARHRRDRLFVIAWRRNAWTASGVADAEGGHGKGPSGGVAGERGGAAGATERRDVLGVASVGGAARGRTAAQQAIYDRVAAKRGPAAQSVVGRAADGVRPRLDVARPGEEQHEWEAPRVVDSEPDRAKRLRALGNAVVPHVAEVVGKRLLEIKKSLDEGRPL